MSKKVKSNPKSTTPLKKLASEELATILRSSKDENGSNFYANLKSLGISSPIIITGEQQIRIRKLVRILREKLLAPPTRPPIYFGSELTTQLIDQSILPAFTNYNLFSTLDLIIIYEADKIKVATGSRLVEVINRHAEKSSTVLILTAKALNQKTAFLNNILPKSTLVELTSLNEGMLKRWIASEAKSAANLLLTNDAVDLLLKFYGDDLDLLTNELSKLSLHSERDQPISAAQIKNISYRSIEASNFELFSTLNPKQLLKAQEIVKNLLAHDIHPLQVNGFLSKCFRMILARELPQDKTEKLTNDLSNAWFLKKISSSTNAKKSNQLVSSLEELIKLDQSLKSTSRQEEILFSRCVLNLCLNQGIRS